MVIFSEMEDPMTDFNIAAKTEDERDKVNVDLAAAGVAYKERLSVPVIAEWAIPELTSHITLSNGSDLAYLKQEEEKCFLK